MHEFRDSEFIFRSPHGPHWTPHALIQQTMVMFIVKQLRIQRGTLYVSMPNMSRKPICLRTSLRLMWLMRSELFARRAVPWHNLHNNLARLQQLGTK